MDSTPPENRPARVLFAEDEVPFRDATADLLRARGFECTCVGTLKAAVSEAEQREYDLLLMDIRLPGNRGLDLVRQVHATGNTPAVIVITAYPSTDTAVEGIDLAVYAYLSKPFRFEELYATVQSALAKRSRQQERDDRVRRLEQGFRRMAVELESLGLGTGLMRGDFAEHANLDQLTSREREVLLAMLQGYRVPSVAQHLGISPNTVRNHLRSIFHKLGVNSQTALIAKVRPPAER
jgi:DNA-binding NarL/FixJ family response regulator